MDTSWNAVFGKRTLYELPMNQTAPLSNETYGRPTQELYPAPATLGRRHMNDRTDDETLMQSTFNEEQGAPKEIVVSVSQKAYGPQTGAEGMMWRVDRNTGLEHLRVRGSAAAGFCAALTTVGINIFRSATFKKDENTDHSPRERTNPGLDLIRFFKDRFSYRKTTSINQTTYYFGFDSPGSRFQTIPAA